MFLREAWEFFKRACMIFTALILVFIIFGTTFSGDVAMGEDGFPYIYVKVLLFGVIACFSAFVSLAVSVSSLMDTDIIFKVLVNFVICYVGFYVSFFVLQGNFSLLGQFAYLSFVFVLAYAVLCALYLVFRGIRTKIDNAAKPYSDVYSELLENDKK